MRKPASTALAWLGKLLTGAAVVLGAASAFLGLATLVVAVFVPQTVPELLTAPVYYYFEYALPAVPWVLLPALLAWLAAALSRGKPVRFASVALAVGLLSFTAAVVIPVTTSAAQSWYEAWPLAEAEQRRLDGLAAAEVVDEYFGSGDPRVELYLLAPETRAEELASGHARERERVGGIDDLTVEPYDGGLVKPSAAWPEVRAYSATFRSRRSNVIGEPPGWRAYLVYVGREPTTGRWRILHIGVPCA